MVRREVTYDRSVSVDHDKFDCALVLKVWDHSDDGGVGKELRIPVEDIPNLMQQIVAHAGYALTTAASRIEVGHCETCGNTGLVDTVGPGGRMTNTYCPDCRDRWPNKPFASAPHIGRRES
jgi:hypothetical protein